VLRSIPALDSVRRPLTRVSRKANIRRRRDDFRRRFTTPNRSNPGRPHPLGAYAGSARPAAGRAYGHCYGGRTARRRTASGRDYRGGWAGVLRTHFAGAFVCGGDDPGRESLRLGGCFECSRSGVGRGHWRGVELAAVGTLRRGRCAFQPTCWWTIFASGKVPDSQAGDSGAAWGWVRAASAGGSERAFERCGWISAAGGDYGGRFRSAIAYATEGRAGSQCVAARWIC
jgi:hypothetical protein